MFNVCQLSSCPVLQNCVLYTLFSQNSSAALDTLHMDRMMADIGSWQEDPQGFMTSRDHTVKATASEPSNVFVLIVEGFLIFNHG